MFILQFLVLQILVFAGVIYFLKKILMGDTQNAIGRLDGVYQDLVKKQKELNEKIKQAEKEYQEKKQEAGEIVDKMKTQAMDEAREKKDDMIKKAKAEAEEIIVKAQEQSDKLAKEIEIKMRNKAIDFCLMLLLRAMGEKNLDKFHIAMVEDFLAKGKEIDLTSVGPQINIVIVRGAMEITEEVKKAVDAIVVQRLGRRLEIQLESDKSLIAGMQLQFGTLIVDATLANAIRDVANEAKEEPLQ